MKYYRLTTYIFFVFFFQLYAQAKDCNSILVEFRGERNKNFEFDLINNTQDTLYLFDSYLNENLYRSKFLHRFNKKEKQCKLSFLPLLPFLSVDYTDRRLTGENKIVNKGQLLYHFQQILPNSNNTIIIHKSAFYSSIYVKEVFPLKKSKFDEIKFRKIKHKKCSSIIVEFAIYKDINLLSTKEAYYFKELDFNKQALSYTVLSVLINIE